MHKLPAFILLMPMAILFTGMMRLGSICVTPGEAACGSSVSGTPAAPQCTEQGCTARPAPVCGEQGCTTCHHKNNQQKEKAPSPCCPECPLCAPVTLSPVFRLEVVRQEKKTEYAVMPDNPLSDYSEPHWKPPNHSLI